MNPDNQNEPQLQDDKVVEDVFAEPERGPLSTNNADVAYKDLPHPNSKKRRFGLKSSVIALFAMLLLSGGAVATYVGVILPNQPDNVVALALSKIITADQLGIDTSTLFEYENTAVDDSKIQVRLDLNVDGNSEVAKVYMGLSDIQVDSVEQFPVVGLDQIQFNLEALFKDEENFYFKVGGLDTLADLYGGLVGADLGSVVSIINNRWIVQDYSAEEQDEAEVQIQGVDVILECTDKIGTAELDFEKILVDNYLENRFFVVKEDFGDEDVNSESMRHFEMTFLAEKARNFANSVVDSLEQDSEVKSCLDAYGADYRADLLSSLSGLTDYDFDIWIDGDKNLRRVKIVIEDGDSKYSVTTDLNIRDFQQFGFPEDAVSIEQISAEISEAFTSAFESSFQSSSLAEFDNGIKANADQAVEQFQQYQSETGNLPPAVDSTEWFDFSSEYLYNFDNGEGISFIYFVNGSELNFAGDAAYQSGFACSSGGNVTTAGATSFAVQVKLYDESTYCVDNS